MSPDRHPIRFNRSAPRVLLFALCISFLFDTAGAAELRGSAWQLESYAELSGSTAYVANNGESTTFPVAGAELGAEIWSATSPFKGGVFASYEREVRSKGDEVLAAGGWARYRYLRWDVVTTLAYVEVRSSRSFWLHAGKLRFQPRPGHKLSIEAVAVVGESNRPAFQIAYGIDLPRNVSLTLGVGLGPSRLFDLAGNAKVVWNVR